MLVNPLSEAAIPIPEGPVISTLDDGLDSTFNSAMASEYIKHLNGEIPIDKAPLIYLKNGKHCTPQHFLSYHHTVKSIEAILMDISFDERFMVFVSEQALGITLQVGIIGPDNYRATNLEKIVYGRKWRVEPELPSSEIIQTVFLAINTAREHELREMLKMNSAVSNAQACWTTPFNNHHDLPLMARNQDLLIHCHNSHQITQRSIQQQLKAICYDTGHFSMLDFRPLNSNRIYIRLAFHKGKHSRLSELNATMYNPFIEVLLDAHQENGFLYQLMNALLDLSKRYVEERFRYKGFARFSRQNCVSSISELSSLCRKVELDKPRDELRQGYDNLMHKVDSARAPRLKPSDYTDKILSTLSRFKSVQGYLPVVNTK